VIAEKSRISIAGEDTTALAGIGTITTDRGTVTQQYPGYSCNYALMQVLPGPAATAKARPKDEP
jgi:hypothetical protein